MAPDENLNSSVSAFSENRVTRIALNAPAQRNRLSAGFVRALLEAITRAAADAGTGCLLIEQRGDVFCSGLDYEELSGSLQFDDLDRLFHLRDFLRKPLVAAVHGACAGAGLGLLLQCHFVLAAQGTKFAVTDIHSAIWPGLYYDALARELGPRRACELALTGRVFSAADALALGLVHELVPPFELEERAFQFASGLASLSPAAVASGLAFAAQANRQSAGMRAAEWLREALATPDFAEALAAARGRRRPVWPSLRAAKAEGRGPEPAP